LNRKGLVVGIILLFIAMAFSSAINVRNDTIFPNAVSEKNVETFLDKNTDLRIKGKKDMFAGG
jgi:hypothetical protein